MIDLRPRRRRDSSEDRRAERDNDQLRMSGSGTVSGTWTREVLGWQPRGIGLIADIDWPEY